MTLGEFQRVMQHVQLGERLRVCFRLPVLMDVIHCTAPCIDICCCPVARVKERMMQLLQPACEDGMRRSSGSGKGRGFSSSCQHTRAAFLPNPLADLWPVEIIEITLPAAAGRVHGGDGSKCRLHTFLAQQLTERIQNDAVADAEEEVERSRYDALGRDAQKGLMRAIDGMLVCRSAMARRREEIVLGNNADGARVSGRRRHEAEDCVDKAPVTVEEGCTSVDEMLQHSPDVRERGGIAGKWCQTLRAAVLQLQPAVSSFVD